MILAFVLVILGLLAICPFVLIALSSYQGTFLEKTNSLLEQYDAIFMSVGTLLIVSGLAVLTARIASQSVSTVEAENRKNRIEMAKIQLKSAKEMKIAEFRQKWIDDMRRDVAEYVSLSATDIMSKETDDKDRQEEKEARRERLTALSSQIYLRLNPNEDLSERLAASIRNISEARRAKDISAMNDLLREFASISREILKGEWRRLKDDLDEAIKETGVQQ
ncbi:hypothetical protein [Ruegeria profundi]|uniref:hypothetical protein n=1 Tax=Ruegeria profundi TaxID=1685378 RepID=UPI001CD4AD2A|nr:hypothetical protein [Ruegeria profundi]MCA0930498.1 hypothetical protein [Ruegeria profundi]